MKETPTLIVLAAGMGSRYGGLKQLDPMGPGGETILDYSVFDAARAGFGRVVFVIRRDFEEAFKESIGKRYAGRIQVDYAFQDLHDLPEGFSPAPGRTKPWGTAHALRSARKVVMGDFAVINADDFYGADAYKVLADHFRECGASQTDPMSMVAYPLLNTLSKHGSVNRGICRIESGNLSSVEEVTGIQSQGNGKISGTGEDGTERQLAPSDLVSMNFWGFNDSVFQPLEKQFIAFLEQHAPEEKSEFYIPTFVDTLIQSGDAQCRVLETSATWFGVTYPEDKPVVQEKIRALIRDGQYPDPLWKDS